MDTELFVFAAASLFLFAVVSKRLEPTPLSGPMLFAAAGVLGHVTGFVDPIEVVESPIVAILELTLALVLFTDAMNVHVASWEADAKIPTRMLLLGMPLTLIAGTVAAVIVFPSLGLVPAAIIATILAPTDAALGQAVVTNERVPVRIREAVGIESGLNDGIALPIILFLIALAGSEAGEPLWSLFAKGVGVGAAVGIGIGLGTGFAVRVAVGRAWMGSAWVQIAVAVVAFGTFLATDHLGGSGFIGAYVAGHAFGRVVGAIDEDAGEFGERLGTALSMLSFLVFGAYILGPHPDVFSLSTVGYAVLSLTVVRMVPVAMSLYGAGVKPPTIAFLGWFGPRGLASIIFTGVVVEEAGVAGSELIIAAMIVTVSLSIVAHGASAPWAAERYGDWYGTSRLDG
jgi:NhaP-type Na+/H+ or K+/H+ antiporter